MSARSPTSIGLALVLALLAPASAAAAERLTPHAFKKVVERARGAVLRVVSTPSGTAILIGVQGEILAEARLLRKDKLTVEYKGAQLEALLVEKDEALGVALLRLPAADYPAAAVGSTGTLQNGSPLVGLSYDPKGNLRAEVGHLAGTRAVKGVTRLRNDVAGPTGSALFDTRGQLVALHVDRPRATLSIDDVRARFAPRRAE